MKGIEKIIKSTKIYKELQLESESYNLECQRKEDRIIKLKQKVKEVIEEKQECILSGQTVIEGKIEEIKNLRITILSLEQRLEEKERQRRKVAGSIGGYKSALRKRDTKIADLNKTIEFLKSNRRSPNIEELKDYEFKRKLKKESEK